MGSLPRLQALLGPEEGQRAEELDALRARIRKSTGGPPEEHRLYLPDGSVEQAVDLLQNGSLFAAHRLVVVHGAELIRTRPEVDAVARYLASKTADATLVLISENVRLDARLEKALPADCKRIFWELFDNQKRGWVVSHFRKHSVSISPEAVELLLELVENNTRDLRTEADKLCVFAGPGGRVDSDDVESFVYHSREESVFSLFRFIVEDDFAAALEVLQKLTSAGDGEPVQLVAGLAFQVRKLLGLRTLLDGRVEFEEACTRLSIKGKRIQADYRRAADRFTVEDLERCIVLLAEYDGSFREVGAGLQPTLLSLLVYQMMFAGSQFAVGDPEAAAVL